MDQKVESLGREPLKGLMHPSVHTRGLPALSYILSFMGFSLISVISRVWHTLIKKLETAGFLYNITFIYTINIY